MLVRRAVSVLGRLAQNVLTNQPKRMGTTTITLESRPEEEYWDIRERHITNNYDEYSVILQRGEGRFLVFHYAIMRPFYTNYSFMLTKSFYQALKFTILTMKNILIWCPDIQQ